MSQKSCFDAFELCSDVILQEYTKDENKVSDAEYQKMLDSRDINFDKVENRLAYTYKYGYFNILFFEKCFSLFINQCTKAVFPFENLKVCSLSNGPGFDIIGLLSALFISNKPLKGLPALNAINAHESWSGLYKTLVCKAYKTYITKSFHEYFHLNPMNINFIQGDIYSTLSLETKNYISNANVLLMVNVFISSKASPTTFENSLTEVFALLQPGTLIFFIGSKNNMKLFSKLLNLKDFVKTICGPQKVALDNLPINEQISNMVGLKPCDSGHAQFVVWKKINKIFKSTEDKQNLSGNNGVPLMYDDSDTISESSIASFVQNQNESNSLKSSNSFFKETNFGEDEKLKNSQDILQSSYNSSSNLIIEAPKNVENSVPCLKYNETSKAKNEISFVNAEADLVSLTSDNKASLFNQTMIDKAIINQNTPSKKSKKEKESLNKTEDYSLDLNSETLQKNSLLNISSKNLIKIEGELSTQTTNSEDLNCTNNNVQSLLERCDNLISQLEKMTVDIKSELNSNKNKMLNKTHFHNQPTQNCRAFHHGCCVKIIHSCCCRNFDKY